MTRVLTILFVFAAFFADDRDKGRKGNKSYHEKKYEEAARLYKEGIVELKESTKAAIRTGLFNNLGAALNRIESFDEASASFEQAIGTAETVEDLSRASYNAGNTAFQAEDPQRALDHYRKALLADPQNERARFNYEFVRRMMESQKESGDSGENQQQQEEQEQQEQEQEPSDDEQEQQEEEQEQGDEEQEQEQQQQEEQEQQEQEPQEESEEMTEEQAEQILQALQNDEQELMRQVWRMKGKPRSVDKDW
jgi:Ca-activated chloride channel family protein